VLAGWARRPKTSQALALRSRIVLRCADVGTIGEVAQDVGVSRNMVSKWRSRFLVDRLDATPPTHGSARRPCGGPTTR